MATSAFAEGDDYIGFDLPPSPGPSRSAHSDDEPDARGSSPGPSNSKGKGRAGSSDDGEDSAGKKRKGGVGESASKRAKHRKSPEPRPEDRVGPRNLKEERRASDRTAPWADDVDWDKCRDPAEMLNEEIHSFYALMTPTPGEYEVRKNMIETITHAVRSAWGDSDVIPFGSWQTQLYLPTGDIDLVIRTPRLSPNASEREKKNVLFSLAGIIKNAGIANTIAVIHKARVPIVKFGTNLGQINVDISINQTNGIQAGRIISHYLDTLPGSRELILVIKAFLSQRSMNEVYTGGVGSYSIICMVVSFLQLHPKVRHSEIDPRSNLGTLLMEFFELYGRNFNYDAVGISIRRGGRYFLKRSKGWLNMAQSFLLCIEDPQDTDNDIARGSFGIRQVKMTLNGAYEMLQATVFDRAAQVAERNANRHSKTKAGRISVPESPQDWTILGRIMGVPKETVKFRRGMENLFAGGLLSRQLEIAFKRAGNDAARLRDCPPRPIPRAPMTWEGGKHFSKPAGAIATMEEEEMNARDIMDDYVDLGPKETNGNVYNPELDRGIGAIVVDDTSEASDSEVSSDGSGATSDSDELEDMELDLRSVSEDSWHPSDSDSDSDSDAKPGVKRKSKPKPERIAETDAEAKRRKQAAAAARKAAAAAKKAEAAKKEKKAKKAAAKRERAKKRKEQAAIAAGGGRKETKKERLARANGDPDAPALTRGERRKLRRERDALAAENGQPEDSRYAMVPSKKGKEKVKVEEGEGALVPSKKGKSKVKVEEGEGALVRSASKSAPSSRKSTPSGKSTPSRKGTPSIKVEEDRKPVIKTEREDRSSRSILEVPTRAGSAKPRGSTPADVPSASASAPGSPRPRGRRARRPERAAFWASKGGSAADAIEVPDDD